MIIQEYVDQEILLKRMEILENTLNSIDIDELLDEAFDINTSLYLYEATTNTEIIKMAMESMKASKAEIKIAKQCKKDNNIKEAIVHLDKADKLLLETDKKLRDIDDFSNNSITLGSLVYSLISIVKSLLFLVPGVVLNFVGGKKLEKDVKDLNNMPLDNALKAVNNVKDKANNITMATRITLWSGVIAGIGRILGELNHTAKVVQNNGDQKSINPIVTSLRNSIDDIRKIISKIKSNYR